MESQINLDLDTDLDTDLDSDKTSIEEVSDESRDSLKSKQSIIESSKSDELSDLKEEVKQVEDLDETKKTDLKLVSEFKKNIVSTKFDPNNLEKLYSTIENKKDAKNYFNVIELLNAKSIENNSNDNHDYLYPHLDDRFFNTKLQNRQEFKDFEMKVEFQEDFEKQANNLCNKDFELANHQLFVKNFLSQYTPYNTLFLYHGLGTGKTCSAIGVSEEMRNYMKFTGSTKRIIIVASPNVQENFKLQLFDESQLKYENNNWVLNNCAGNNLLKEINLLQDKLSREKVIKIVKNLINTYYLFMGYIEFSNLIAKKSNIDDIISIKKTLSDSEKKNYIKNRLQNFFDSRLIIIDEIHNIRKSNDKENKLVSNQLNNLVKNVNNLKLLLMSATPMFNDHREIINIVNIMNMNDNRFTIDVNDVFNKDGSFIKNEKNEEIGKQLLKRKINGYFSYVKGDNPFIFPYRILPNDFNQTNSILHVRYPINQLNDKLIENPIQFFDLYINNIDKYQELGYNYILNDVIKNKFDIDKLNNMDSFGYQVLQKPLEALNIVYPHPELIENIEATDLSQLNKIYIKDLVGKNALNNLMSYREPVYPKSRSNYKFRDEKMENIFLYENIGKYSIKIKSILDNIVNSQGPIIIYSQFIDGGLIPMALALESMGFLRHNNNSLFDKQPVEPLDILTFKPKTEALKMNSRFKQASYVMITGNKTISPNNNEDLKSVNNANNINGNEVKIILLSSAGSEGLDFKFIRQIHIMEPWYNINRIEQIIGRGVRTCSHKDLPLTKRNVQIFMHATFLNQLSSDKEAVDLFIYRKAEEKAKKIGEITRLIKETSIDCQLNYQQQKFTKENLNKSLKLVLSNLNEIDFKIGDKINTALCDYMESCNYKCIPQDETDKTEKHERIDMSTYNSDFLQTNNEKIIQIIRDMYKEQFFYTKFDIIKHINFIKEYSLIYINNALTELVENPNIYITDKYDNIGTLINIDDLYIFQPLYNVQHQTSLFTKENLPSLSQDKVNIVTSDHDKKMSKKIQLHEDDDKTFFSNKLFIDNLLNLIKKNYELCFKNYTLQKGETIEKDNKYISISNAVTKILENKLIDKTILKDIVLDIVLEDIEYNNRIQLINYLLMNEDDESLSDFNKSILIYYRNKFIKNRDSSSKNLVYILPINSDFEKYTLYCLKTQESNQQLVLAQSEDYYEFGDTIKTLTISDTYLNNIFGFLVLNKKLPQDFVLDIKIKSGENKGAKCNQAQKKTTEKIFKDIGLSQETIELFKTFKQQIFCYAQEIYFRYFNLIKKNDKIWFLDSTMAYLNNLS